MRSTVKSISEIIGIVVNNLSGKIVQMSSIKIGMTELRHTRMIMLISFITDLLILRT